MHCGSLLAFWRSATTSLNILPERNKSADSASHIYVSRLLVFSIHIFPPLLSPLWCIVFSFFTFYIFSFFNIPPERYKSAGSAPWIHTCRLLCSLFPHSVPFYSFKAKKLLLQINFLKKIRTQSEILCSFFLRPRSDHCPSLAVTKQLTQWLTPFVETWMMWLWLREMPTIQICQKHHKPKLTNQIHKIKPTKSPVPNQV